MRGMAMEIRLVRKPGDKGTQALLQKYAEQNWQPRQPHPEAEKATGLTPKRYHPRCVGVRLGHLEFDLRKNIFTAARRWNPAERLWFLPEEEVRKLGLVQRVEKR